MGIPSLDIAGAEHTTQVSPDFPNELICNVICPDGLTFAVRPIRPDDADRLISFHEHLSTRSCYMRFFTFHPHLSQAEVDRFTRVDYEDRLALVALSGDAIVAVARYDRHSGTTEAEVAFVVADEYQHHGIGSFLLDEIVEAAYRRGLTDLWADTLEENHPMLSVFLHCGFPVTRHTEYGTTSLRFPISPSAQWESRRSARRAGWNISNRGVDLSSGI